MGKLLQRISNAVIGSIERFFYFWGYNIAKRPWFFIGICLTVTLISCTGLVCFHRETRGERLFIPAESNYYKTAVFLSENFPPPFRQEFAIVTADDVLQPHAIQKMLLIHQKVSNFTISSGTSWKDHCFKFPVVSSMGDELELFKGFRNRVIMRRSFDTSDSSNIMEPIDMFDDDFIDENLNMKSHRSSTTEKTVPKQRLKQNQESSTTKTELPHSVFDNFDSDFSNNEFRNTVTNKTDLSIAMPSHLYCALVESIPKACWEFSILELWKYDPQVIGNLTKEDIVHAVNTIKKSPVFGSPADYLPLFGGMKYDSEGRLISATSLMAMWHIEVNNSNLDFSKHIMDIGVTDPADAATLDWELMFVNEVLSEDSEDGHTRVLVRAWRSFSDVSTNLMMAAFLSLSLGGIAMFIYIVVMMSEVNIVDARFTSALMGVTAVLLSFISAVGVCSAFGVFFGPLHPFIGIILLGLGVDDAFVIVQCYNILSDTEKVKPLPEKIGLTLKHAGASITVTSFTNSIAFSVGSLSVFPTLSSLCMYLAVGVMFLFIYQATFFVAFFVLEQKRIAGNRNSIIVCYKHENKIMKFKYVSVKGLLQSAFNKVSTLITNVYFKVTIIAITICLLCASGWGISKLEAKFQPHWMLSRNSFLYTFGEVFLNEIRTNGEEGMFILANINYTSEMNTVEDIVNKINYLNNSIAVVDDWYTGFREYVNTNFEEDVPNRPLPEDKFLFYLGKYLFSPSGAQHQKSFRFEQPLVCGHPAPTFQISLMPFRMLGFKNGGEYIPGMQRIRTLVNKVNFKNTDSWMGVWSYSFLSWEGEERIMYDTIVNLIIAAVAVSGCTLISLANIHGCLLVMTIVFITLIEVFGFMYMWDIQINICSAIALVLCIGMSVDFAVHITHIFLKTEDETKDNRAVRSFRSIGPAVFNGAISTLLACLFILLGHATALDIFIKTNVLLVTFGLYNGLILLPVLLSIIGPRPYDHLSNEDGTVETKTTNSDNMLLEQKHDCIIINNTDYRNGNINPEEEVILTSVREEENSNTGNGYL